MLQTGFSEKVRKILLETLKVTCEEKVQMYFTFSQVLLKDFHEIFQNSY